MAVTMLGAASPFHIALIWGELVEAYYGVNRFGGKMAEIYSYRLQPFEPGVHSSPHSRNTPHSLELQAQAADLLVEICRLFAEVYCCGVLIENLPPDRWRKKVKSHFAIRVVIEVKLLPKSLKEGIGARRIRRRD